MRKAPASTTIYGLRSSDGVIRYVGQTRYSLMKRLANHVAAARRYANDLHRWIAETHASGTLEIVALRSVPTNEATTAERRMIQAYRKSGNLLNIRDGWRSTRDEALLSPILVESEGAAFMITCPAYPEVATFADRADEIIRRANDAIEEAMFSTEADQMSA